MAARLTQIPVEVLIEPADRKARLTQIVIEVLVEESTAPAVSVAALGTTNHLIGGGYVS